MLSMLRKLHILHTWSNWEDISIHKGRFSPSTGELIRFDVPGQRRTCAVCNQVELVAI